MKDTGDVSVKYCPGCDARDPLKEILTVAWCFTHAPSREGDLDKKAETSLRSDPLNSSGEGDGYDGRRYAQFLNRRK